MSFLTQLGSTLKSALSTIRNPTRGIKRAVARIAFRAATRAGESLRDIRQWAAESVIAEAAEGSPHDILEIFNAEQKEALMGSVDPSKKVPTHLMVESHIKEQRKYLVTWRVKKRFTDGRPDIDTYVSGYFDENLPPDQWYLRWEEAVKRGNYEMDYEILQHSLARVQHRIGAEF